MERTPKHTPESVAESLCHVVYAQGYVTAEGLPSVKLTFTRIVADAWPTRKPRAAKKDAPK